MDLTDPGNVDVVKIAQVIHTAIEYYHAMSSSPLAFPVAASACLLLLLLLVTDAKKPLVDGWLSIGKFIRRRRENAKMRRERRDFVERKFGDLITDLVEKEVGEGTFTRKEAQRFYKQLGHAMKLSDIIPRVPLQKRLRSLKGRLKAKHKDRLPLVTTPRPSLLERLKSKVKSA